MPKSKGEAEKAMWELFPDSKLEKVKFQSCQAFALLNSKTGFVSGTILRLEKVKKHGKL